MLTSRRATRIHHAALDAHLVPIFQECEQTVEIHAHRRAGVKGHMPPKALDPVWPGGMDYVKINVILFCILLPMILIAPLGLNLAFLLGIL